MDNKLVIKEIKEAGLKITMPRQKILEIFHKNQNAHLSAEEVHKHLVELKEDIGLATVYRVLAQFEDAKLILKHRFDEEHAVFELNNKAHHDHLVCIKCGHIEEFVDDLIEKQQEVIANEHKFKISAHSLYLYGTCKKCTT